jgi:hypothetical protein
MWLTSGDDRSRAGDCSGCGPADALCGLRGGIGMIGLSRLFLRRRRQSVATIRTPHSPGHRQVVRFARPKASTVRSVRLWTLRLVHAQGALAQLVARFHGMEEVRGSSPLSSTAKVLVSAYLILRDA